MSESTAIYRAVEAIQRMALARMACDIWVQDMSRPKDDAIAHACEMLASVHDMMNKAKRAREKAEGKGD